MIIVQRLLRGSYAWHSTAPVASDYHFGRATCSDIAYASADHALRDAWMWWPELPALVYTRRP